jgi:hypothetical protein
MTGMAARILGVLLVIVLSLFLVGDCVSEFVQNDVWGFFAKAPYLLLVAACIGVVGGGLVWLVSRLPGRLRGKLLLSAWAVGNIALTVFGLGMLWLCCGEVLSDDLERIAWQNAIPAWLRWQFGAVGLLALAIAGFSWFLLVRLMMRGDKSR